MSWRCPSTALAVGALCGALQGCTPLLAEQARFTEGWRPGRVVQIDAAAAIRSTRFAKDCRAELPLEVVARNRYALVRYSEAPSRYAYRVAPLSEAETIKVGDRVQVNIRRCDAPLVADEG